MKKLWDYWPFFILVSIVISSFLYAQWVIENRAISFSSALDQSLANWDVLHYLTIAQKGYTIPFQLAFPPGYPWAIASLTLITGNCLLAGIFVSLISLVLYISIMKRVALIYLSEKAADQALVLQLLFPTAYFFLIPYSESLFLVLTSLTFLAFTKNRWLLMGVCAGLATLTRSVGILLLPTLALGILSDKDLRIGWSQKLLPLIFIPLATSIHWWIAYQDTGNWLGILAIHAREGNRQLVIPFSSFVENIFRIFSFTPSEYVVQVIYAETLAISFALILTIFSFRLLPKMFAIYNVLYLLLISSSSFLISNPRLILGAFPLFWTLAILTEQKKSFYLFIITFFAALLALEAATFARGHWAF